MQCYGGALKSAEDFQRRAAGFESLSRWVTDPGISGEALRLLSRRPSLGRLLDVGGGTGFLSYYLANRLDYQSVTVVDPSSNMLSIAQSRMPWAAVSNTSFEEFCLLDRGCYDTVLARQVLHYVSDADATTRKLHSKLADSGLAYVGQFTVPDDASDRWHAAVVKNISSCRLRSFTPATLERCLIEGGFKVAESCASDYEENLADFYQRRGMGGAAYGRLLSEARESLNRKVENSLAVRVEDDNLYFTVQFTHMLLERCRA